jgi:hypothetical protein
VLIFQATFGQTKARAMPATGSIRSDLYIAYRWAADEFSASGSCGDSRFARRIRQQSRTGATDPDHPLFDTGRTWPSKSRNRVRAWI